MPIKIIAVLILGAASCVLLSRCLQGSGGDTLNGDLGSDVLNGNGGGDFSGLSAEGASFQSAELQRANFSGATLSNADFEKAELGRASFDGARLGGNSFVFANLARADFSGADITGALDFSNAYLFLMRIEGADLSAATGLAQSQIDIACGNAETKLPQGLSRPAKWPCAED